MLRKLRCFNRKITFKLLAFIITASILPVLLSISYLRSNMENLLINYQQKEVQHFSNNFYFNINKYKNYMLLIAEDYSYWDDTYFAVKDNDIHWLKGNIIDWLPEGFNFTYVAIIDDSNQLITENEYGFFHMHKSYLLATEHIKTPNLLTLNDNLYFIVSTPILKTDLSSASGRLIIATKVKDDFVSTYLQLMDIGTSIFINDGLYNGDKHLLEFLQTFEKLPEKPVVLNDNLLLFLPINNNNNDTIATGIVALPYDFYMNAINTLRISRIIVYLISFLVIALATYFIKKNLVDPLVYVQDVINKIKLTKQPLNIEIKSEDEIGQLAHSFNSLARVIDEHNKHLKKLSITDSITGLYNYSYFHKQMELRINNKTPFTLTIIEVHFLKEYSNIFSRTKTDELLKKIGGVFSSSLKDGDENIFILGPTTFSVMFSSTNMDEIIRSTKVIQKKINNLIFWGRNKLPTDLVCASVGIVQYPNEASTKDALIKIADNRLFKARNFLNNKIGSFYSVFHDSGFSNLTTHLSSLYLITKTFLAILQSMDSYTLCHSEGVAKYSVTLGYQLGLSEDDMETLHYSALLHDIGKIEFGAELLNKQGPLSPKEIKLIRSHTIFAENILRPMEGFEKIIPIVRSHHEWYDGNGYPDGLKDTYIPFLSRIISIADAYDTMITNRPYRNSTKSSEEAIEELRRCAGTQFDPELVDSFIESLKHLSSYTGINIS